MLNFSYLFVQTVQFAVPSSLAGNTILDVSNCNLTKLNQAAFESTVKYFVDHNFPATGSNTAYIKIDSSIWTNVVIQVLIVGSILTNWLLFQRITLTDPFDCSPSTCGSESWLIVNSQYKSFVSTTNGAPTCGDVAKTDILALNPVICQCPFEDVHPCTCSITQGEVASPPVTVSINCSGLALGDQGVETLLNKVPVTNAMVGVVLSGNNLTYVPTRLAQFQNLVLVVLTNNNISTVKQGDLALASPQANTIDLSNNQIKTIENGSFPSELPPLKIVWFNIDD